MIRKARRNRAWLFLACGLLLSATGPLSADEQAQCADCRRAERMRRTGYPLAVKRLATPSNTRFYGSYSVGGGSLVCDEPRDRDEGTWGWDYSGSLFAKRVALGWTNGRRYQGGSGRYGTVGPTLLRTQ